MAKVDAVTPNAPPLVFAWTGRGVVAATLAIAQQHSRILGAVLGLRIISTLVLAGLMAPIAEPPRDPRAMVQYLVHEATHPWIWGALVWWAASLTLASFIEPAAFFAVVYERETRQPCPWRKAFAWSHKVWLSYTGTSLIVQGLAALGSPFLLIPTVMVITRTLLFGPMIVFDGLHGLEACRASAAVMDQPKRRAALRAGLLLGLLAGLVFALQSALEGRVSTLFTQDLSHAVYDMLITIWYFVPLTIYLAVTRQITK